MQSLGQTEPVDTNGGEDEDFLARERAALGDDANQFAATNDLTTTVEDADDDLLGGGGDFQASNNEAVSGFESSFPAIESQNEVRIFLYVSLTGDRKLRLLQRSKDEGTGNTNS